MPRAKKLRPSEEPLKPGHRWAVHTDWEAKGRCEKELLAWAKNYIYNIFKKHGIPQKSPDQMKQYKHACDFGIPNFFTFLLMVRGDIGERSRKLQKPRVESVSSRDRDHLEDLCKSKGGKGEGWIVEGYCDGDALIERSVEKSVALLFFNTKTQESMWEHLHISLSCHDNKDQAFQYDARP